MYLNFAEHIGGDGQVVYEPTHEMYLNLKYAKDEVVKASYEPTHEMYLNTVIVSP